NSPSFSAGPIACSFPLNANWRTILKHRLCSCNGRRGLQSGQHPRGLRMPGTNDAVTSLVVNGTTIEAVDRGKGRTILCLHPGSGIEANAPVLAELSRGGRVLAPSHPGFGTSQLPKGMSTVDDIAYFYLDMLEQLDLRDMLVVGVGLGG